VTPPARSRPFRASVRSRFCRITRKRSGTGMRAKPAGGSPPDGSRPVTQSAAGGVRQVRLLISPKRQRLILRLQESANDELSDAGEAGYTSQAMI